MNTNLSRLLRAGVLAGGLMAVSAGVAHAAETTGGHDAPGPLSGNQVAVPIQTPITVGGNAVSVLAHSVHAASGASSASSGAQSTTPGHSRHGGASGATAGSTSPSGPTTGVASTDPAGHPGPTSLGGLLAGNQVLVPICAPVDVSGNAVAVLSGASAAGDPAGCGGSPATAPSSAAGSRGGAASGNQVAAPVQAPVNVGGNAVSVLGRSSSANPSSAGTAGSSAGGTGSTGGTSTGGASTVGDGSSVLGLHLSADRSTGAASDASLAMTGGVATPLLGIGSLLALTGLLLRFAGRGRIRAER
jgi:ChpA-C